MADAPSNPLEPSASPTPPRTPPPPPPLVPRPVIPLDPTEAAAAELGAMTGGDAPPMAIAEPGVVPPAPFGNVYSPPPPTVGTAGGQPSSMTMTPPTAVGGGGYYPPAYPPPAWPAAPPMPPPPHAHVGYRAPAASQYGRPGIITALGVTGIVFAALSLVASVFSGCTGTFVMGYSARMAVWGRGGGMATTASVTPGSGVGSGMNADIAGPNGLTAADRAVAIDAFKRKARRVLTPRREEQLDAFLAEHGKRLFTPPDGGLTPKVVAEQIARSGQMAGGADFFVLQQTDVCPTPGQLTLRDSGAVFAPDDRTAELRSVAKPKPAGGGVDVNTFGTPQPGAADPAVADSGSSPPLDDSQANAVVGRIRQLSNNRLKASQGARVTTLLQSPSSAHWIENTANVPGLTSQVASAIAQSDGSLTVNFTNGTSMPLDATGHLIGPVPPPPAVNAAAAATTQFSLPAFVGPISVPSGSYTMAIAEAVLSGLVAIYLLVVSILVLRQTPIGRRLFFIFAAAKLLCGLLAIVAFVQILDGVSAHYLRGPVTTSLVFAVIGMIFPIAVLLTLGSRPVREYYQTAR